MYFLNLIPLRFSQKMLQELHHRLLATVAINTMNKIFNKQLQLIKNTGTWKLERIITSKQDSIVDVDGKDGKQILNMCANNYLGLSSHRDVIESAKRAIDTHGSGLSSVRFICGTQDIHKNLEKKIVQFYHGGAIRNNNGSNRDDAILYASCFDANAGLFEALLTAEDAIISDELNHASIIDGIRLCKAKRFRYKNADMSDLEEHLKSSQDCRMRLIATDGVFSMDGVISPLPQICELAERYNALVFVDDAHATGFIGKTGRGTEEYWNLKSGSVHIVNSTLGKALGGAAGGYTVGPQTVVDLLRQKSRPYLFSNSLPPAVVGAASAVFDILMHHGSDLTSKVTQNTRRFRGQMRHLGFTMLGSDEHPICPVLIGDASLTATIANELFTDYGIFSVGLWYPVVAKGRARIRIQISASHTFEHIDRAISAFERVGKKHGLI